MIRKGRRNNSMDINERGVVKNSLKRIRLRCTISKGKAFQTRFVPEICVNYIRPFWKVV